MSNIYDMRSYLYLAGRKRWNKYQGIRSDSENVKMNKLTYKIVQLFFFFFYLCLQCSQKVIVYVGIFVFNEHHFITSYYCLGVWFNDVYTGLMYQVKSNSQVHH